MSKARELLKKRIYDRLYQERMSFAGFRTDEVAEHLTDQVMPIVEDPAKALAEIVEEEAGKLYRKYRYFQAVNGSVDFGLYHDYVFDFLEKFIEELCSNINQEEESHAEAI